ncbi:MAG: aminotransferase class III-fold pyridoxal phosphate-dependent enzyme [Promethearchaeota archaeon]
MSIISQPKFLKHVQDMRSEFSGGLLELQESYSEKIVDVRGHELMWGIEFIDEFTSLHFTLTMIKKGVWCDYYCYHKVTNKFFPLTIIRTTDIDEILKRTGKSLKEIKINHEIKEKSNVIQISRFLLNNIKYIM